MLSPVKVLIIIGVFGAVMLAISMIRKRTAGLEVFLAANRSVGVVVGAMSVASTWIWAPALFIAAQKSYQQGLPGLMWFTVPNVCSLVLFAFLAPRIRARLPHGYTLPEYVAKRFDTKTHLVYLFGFLSLQICSLAVQLIAGASLLQAMSGLPYAVGVITLAAMFTAYSLIDGLRTSIRTDLIQMMVILCGIAAIVPLAVVNSGGWPTIAAGLGGFSGQHRSLFDPYVAYTFGVTVAIGLMSGPVGDQQHWQRAFAFAEGNARRGYLWGAAIFAIVPLSLSLLGFIAAGNPQAAPAVANGLLNAQQVGPEVIRSLLPPWGILVFMLMILGGLASTGDSALCAGGSMAVVDIYRQYLNPNANDQHLIAVARFSIICIALVAISIALIPKITILSLFLFYGTLRSSTLMPTLLILFRKHLSANGVFWGVFLAMTLGTSAYLYGEWTQQIHVKVAANVGILLVSGLIPLVLSRRTGTPALKLERES